MQSCNQGGAAWKGGSWELVHGQKGKGPKERSPPHERDMEPEEDVENDPPTNLALPEDDMQEHKRRMHKLSNSPMMIFSKG